jgi:hypothetical protein
MKSTKVFKNFDVIFLMNDKYKKDEISKPILYEGLKQAQMITDYAM